MKSTKQIAVYLKSLISIGRELAMTLENKLGISDSVELANAEEKSVKKEL